MLERLVLRIRGEQHQVFQPVVRRIVVDVVDALRPQQRTTNRHGNRQPVLHHVSVRPRHLKHRRRTADVLYRLIRIRPLPIPISKPAFP